MEFQQLEMFAAVVEEGGVSRAAERVFRTAAAVSIALTKLEEEFGVKFLDRSDRSRTQLTQPGKLLYSYARRILDLRQEANSAIRDGAQRRREILRLGTHESTSLYLLLSLLRPFNAAHSEIKTEIICGNSERLVTALSNQTIDLALIGDAEDDPNYQRHLIARDGLVLITNPNHRLASLKEVGVSDLANEFLIVQSSRSKLRQRLTEAFAQTEIRFQPGVENIAIETIKLMVIENFGVGFVPRMCVQEELKRGELVAMSVNGVRSDWDLWLVRLKGERHSPAARTFFDLSLALAPTLNISRTPTSQQRSEATSPMPHQKLRQQRNRAIRC